MYITKLRWSNCFSYPNTLHELDIPSETARQLIGVNGAGKTSIACILQEGLVGSNSFDKKKGHIPNRYTDNKGYFIEVEFEAKGNSYTITTDRKSKLTLTLVENGIDISEHTATATYKKVLSIIGMDKSLLFNLIYQSSRSSVEFITATDKGRKEYLIKVFNLDNYAETRKNVVALIKECEEDKVTYEKLLEGALAKQEVFSNTAALDKLEEHDIPTENKALEARKLELHAIITEAKNTDNKIKEIEDKILIKRRGISSIPKDPEYPDADRVEEINIELLTLSLELDALTTEIMQLDVKIETECPLCKQSLEYDKDLLARQEERLAKAIEEKKSANAAKLVLTKELEELDIQFSKYRRDRSLITRNTSRNEALLIDIQLLEEERNLISLAKVEHDYSAEYSKVLLDIAEEKKHREYLIKENGTIAHHNIEIDNAIKEVEVLAPKIQYYTNILEGIEIELGNARILKEVFGTKGLVAYKIDSMFSALEVTINKYMSIFTAGQFQLNLAMEEDKLALSILDNGVKISPVELSTGEFNRVNCSVLLAIRKLMGNLNLLFLDEISGVLDDEGNEKLVEVLLNEENLNSFIVSHSYTHPLLEKIVISKKDNISEISTW